MLSYVDSRALRNQESWRLKASLKGSTIWSSTGADEANCGSELQKADFTFERRILGQSRGAESAQMRALTGKNSINSEDATSCAQHGPVCAEEQSVGLSLGGHPRAEAIPLTMRFIRVVVIAG